MRTSQRLPSNDEFEVTEIPRELGLRLMRLDPEGQRAALTAWLESRKTPGEATPFGALDERRPERRRRTGRNQLCWCGSGRKYKKCHLAADERAAIGRPP